MKTLGSKSRLLNLFVAILPNHFWTIKCMEKFWKNASVLSRKDVGVISIIFVAMGLSCKALSMLFSHMEVYLNCFLMFLF